MKIFKADEKQQAMLEAFFKEQKTYFPNTVMAKYLAVFFVGVSLILLVIPFREWEGEDAFSLIMGPYLYLMGMAFYSGIYTGYQEPLTKQTVRFATLLQYLPVEKGQLVVFRIRKIFKPCLILTLAVLFMRICISLGAYHRLEVWDVLIPVCSMLVLPILYEFFARWGMTIRAR